MNRVALADLQFSSQIGVNLSEADGAYTAVMSGFFRQKIWHSFLFEEHFL